MTDKKKHRETTYLTTSQAARLLSVSPDTVLKWVKAGKVKSYRTLGGHFRIPTSEINVPPPEPGWSSDEISQRPVHQYCWEFLSGGGEIKAECKECITYRSGAQRCYELKDLPGGMGCLNLLCDTECTNCEYYKVVVRQGLNILVISKDKKLVRNYKPGNGVKELRLKFSTNEYETATLIHRFRPDYVVVDCAFGRNRTAHICEHLFSDIRIPIVRIILSSKNRQIRDYCDREVFGWIRKPFSIEQLRECVRGVPASIGAKND